MKRKLFSNKLWLRVGMLVAIMTTALSGTAWAETVTKTESWTFDGTDTWTSGIGKYCGLYGSKSNSTTVKNASITNFSNVNFSTVTSPSVVVKVNGLTNNGTNSYTVSLVDEDGNDIGTEVTVTGKLGNGSNSSSAKESEVTLTPVSGATGYRITVPTKGALKGTSYTLTYIESSSSLTSSDLAITDAPVDLSFDLFNNASAQTVSYTTSSTGAITITPASPTSYFSYVHDAANKTITVTPLAVTPNAQTITISQAEDATYDAGSKTFTVTVTDSTPFAGGDVTFDATTDTGTSPLVKKGVTFECTSGVLNNGSEYRLYKNSVTTFSVTEGAITQIVFTGVSSNPASGFETQTGWTIDGNDGTWIGNASSVSFTASGAQVRATEIVVTVDMSATPDPVINADDVDITYDAEEGEIEYTIGNPVNGGSLVASTTADWLTVDDAAKTASTGTINFICNPNPAGTQRTAEVTLTYTYNTNETLTKTIVITQAGNPDALVTIAEARAQGTGNVHTKGIVTSSVGTTAYIQDANAAICVYGESLTVGDEIEVSGTLTDFHGLLEITEPTVTVLSQENTVTPEVLTIAQVKASTKQGWLVKIENATVTEVGSNNNYTIAQGEETITLHGALGTEVSVNDIITFNGNIGCFTNVQIVNPTDVTVTGTVTPTTYTLSWTAGEHTELFVYDAADLTTSLTSGDDIAAGTTILVSVDVESGYELESLEVDGEDVTSQIDESGAYTFTMPTHAVTVSATAVVDTTPTKTLTNANIVAAGDAGNSYSNWEITDENGKTWNAHAIKNKHSNATSAYHYLQIKKYASSTAYYLQVPEYGTKITSITMTVSSSSSPMTGGENSATLFFSASNSTSTAGDGVASGTGASTVTIDCSSLNLNTGYITASGAVRIWDVTVVYEETESVTVTDAGYATYCSENALDFTNVTGITAYVGTIEGTHLTFTPITQVPANTGLLLKAEGGAKVDVPVIASAPALTNTNCLTGTNEAITLDEDDYILNVVNGKAGFYRATTQYTALAAHRAYISAEAGKGVKSFIFDDDDATAISSVESFTEEGAIYNVAGQRLQKMQKGINIVNGKKILY